MPELFSLSSDALPVPVDVLGFRATEALSLPYRFEVAFALRTGADLDALTVLQQARRVARQHVIVKWPQLLPPLLLPKIRFFLCVMGIAAFNDSGITLVAIGYNC